MSAGGEGGAPPFQDTHATDDLARRMPDPPPEAIDSDGFVWNFAYGSNLQHETRESRVGVNVERMVRGVLPGWRLTFNVPGVRYVEPSFASVEPLSDAGDGNGGVDARTPPPLVQADSVHGVLLRMSVMAFKRLMFTEGQGMVYDGVLVHVKPYAADVDHVVGQPPGADTVPALVLRVKRRRACPERPPSQRYLGIVLHGAVESALDDAYVAKLRAVQPAQLAAPLRILIHTVQTGFRSMIKSPIGARIMKVFVRHRPLALVAAPLLFPVLIGVGATVSAKRALLRCMRPSAAGPHHHHHHHHHHHQPPPPPPEQQQQPSQGHRAHTPRL